MENKEVVYFSVNNWFSGENYPPTKNFKKWLSDDFNQSFRNDEWCKENKLCVYYGCVDMSTIPYLLPGNGLRRTALNF